MDFVVYKLDETRDLSSIEILKPTYCKITRDINCVIIYFCWFNHTHIEII